MKAKPQPSPWRLRLDRAFPCPPYEDSVSVVSRRADLPEPTDPCGWQHVRHSLPRSCWRTVPGTPTDVFWKTRVMVILLDPPC